MLTSRIWPHEKRPPRSLQDTLAVIERAFRAAVRQRIEELPSASERCVFVWDRAGAITVAKKEEATARAQARAREVQRYRQAETIILTYLETRPALQHSASLLRRRPYRHFKKIKIPLQVYSALAQIRKSAWAMVDFPSHLFIQSAFQEPTLPARTSYDGEVLSAQLQQALGFPLGPHILHCEALNEADNTISRIARHYHRDFTIVVLSSDTDFLVRDSVEHIPWTLSRLLQRTVEDRRSLAKDIRAKYNLSVIKAFTQTLVIRKPGPGDTWTTRRMALSPQRLQSLTRCHQQRLAKMRAAWLWQSSAVTDEECFGDLYASILLRGSTNYRHQMYQHELRTARVRDRAVKEIMSELGFNPDLATSDPTLKVLFAIGATGSKRSGVRRGTAHFGNSLLAAVVKFAKQRSYRNFVPVRVTEHWTSQVCPTQSCRRMRGAGWQAVPFNPATAIRSKYVQKLVLDCPINGSRGSLTSLSGRLYKPLFTDSKTPCQRLLQCEKCHTIRHRDVAGAENIGYAAWHFIVHGRHPWKSSSA